MQSIISLLLLFIISSRTYSQLLSEEISYRLELQPVTDSFSQSEASQKQKEVDQQQKIPKIFETFENEMVEVEGGTFRMGCSSEQDTDCFDDEKPAHFVTLGSFKISKYDVTQAQWQFIMGSNPSNNRGCDQCPVTDVSWYDVDHFIEKLNKATGRHYRLPTEAEWEYAARGGNQSKGYKYSGSNDVSEVAWYKVNSGGTTHPVGQKRPNELGLYDMSGNVWQSCDDYYGPYDGGSANNPTGEATGETRVVRGGNSFKTPWNCRVSARGFGFYWGSPDLSFRLVSTP